MVCFLTIAWKLNLKKMYWIVVGMGYSWKLVKHLNCSNKLDFKLKSNINCFMILCAYRMYTEQNIQDNSYQYTLIH